MGGSERVEQARVDARAALHAHIASLLDLWGDHTAAARWQDIPQQDCTMQDAADTLTALLATSPIVLDPARLHRIEAAMRRLWCHLAWWYITGRLDATDAAAWANVLELWQARPWSTRGRISA